MKEQDEKFLRQAIALSRQGMERGKGGPFGALVVKNGEVIGQGCNEVTSSQDPTAHAEIVAIRKACKKLNSFQLTDCVIYTSCEPCPMCLGAVYWARPARLVYACTHEDAARAGFDDSFIYRELSLKAAKRSLKTEQFLRAEGQKVMQAWQKKQDRIDY